MFARKKNFLAILLYLSLISFLFDFLGASSPWTDLILDLLSAYAIPLGSNLSSPDRSGFSNLSSYDTDYFGPRISKTSDSRHGDIDPVRQGDVFAQPRVTRNLLPHWYIFHVILSYQHAIFSLKEVLLPLQIC